MGGAGGRAVAAVVKSNKTKLSITAAAEEKNA